MMAANAFGFGAATCPARLERWEPLVSSLTSVDRSGFDAFMSLDELSIDELESLAEAVDYCEQYLKRHERFESAAKDVGILKLRIKLAILALSEGRKRREWMDKYVEVNPSLLYGSEVNWLSRLILFEARTGDVLMTRLLLKLRKMFY